MSRLLKIVLPALLLLTSTSCVTISMDEETKVRVDKALAEVDRISGILEAYQTDVKSLVERLNRLIDKFAPEPKKQVEKPEDKSP